MRLVGIADPGRQIFAVRHHPQTGHVETLVTLHFKGAPIEVTLPEREATPWDDTIPEWPSNDKYAKTEYPDFVEQ